MRLARLMAATALAACAAAGQEIHLPPSLERLADKAETSVDVTLNKAMLQMAAKFMSDRDADEARTRKLLAGLERILVRSFEFARGGEYSPADVDTIRAQVQTGAWSRVIGVKSKNGENADVYFKNGAGGELGGIVVIAADPRSLTIVEIAGTIDPSQLGDLGGQFGIPRFDLGGMRIERKSSR